MIVLVCATPMELKPVLGKGQTANAVPGQPFPARLPESFIGVPKGRRDVLALVTGVGPVNAALAAGRTLAGHEISGMVNIGVAGTYDEKALPMLATAVATAECWPDFGLATETGIDPKGIGLSLGRVDNVPVFDRLELDPDKAARTMRLTLPETWRRGDSVTVGAASGTPAHAQALRTRYGACTENMEGFALAWACTLAGIPFLEIRTVSNLVGSREPGHWKLGQAVAELANVVAQLFSVTDMPDQKA